MDRSDTTAFIEAQQYSKFIIDNLPTYQLPDGFARDVSDFQSGTTLNIKTVGAVTLQDVSESVPLNYTNIDSGNVTLTISDYIGTAWKITDELRQDGAQVETLASMQALAATQAVADAIETKFLAACNSAQTNAATNAHAGFAHRRTATGTSSVMTMEDFIAMKLAFDKANVMQGGRVAIVDPIVEATLNGLTNLVNVSNNPMFEGLVNEGFARDHKFVKNIFGWDIYTSNKLYRPATGSLGDGTTNVTGGIANVFMCLADDNARPMMRAMRLQPKTEGWRDSEVRADKFQVTSRFGFGAQRTDTLGIVITSPTAY
jgi:hypothetical protein